MPQAPLDALLAARAPIADIAALLDGLDHAGRWDALRGLTRAQQRQLFQSAAEAPPIDLQHFAPPDRADLTPVVHHGRNSLPLPPSWRFFRKPMCRPAGEAGRLFGYNDSPTGALIGPGYFVARPTEGEPAWAERGGVVIDYFMVPDGPVAEGWPPVKRNDQGLQVLVYHQTRDFMRRVSAHVSIGAAYKKEKALDHYFVLCRED